MKYLLLAVILTGCSTIEAFTDKAADANDKILSSSIFQICNASSVGAIKRQFDTLEKSKLWQDLCSVTTGFSLVEE